VSTIFEAESRAQEKYSTHIFLRLPRQDSPALYAANAAQASSQPPKEDGVEDAEIVDEEK